MPDLKLLKVEKYTLKDGDTLDTIASSKSIPVTQLKLFNFGTEDEVEIKKYYWGKLGCSGLHDNGAFKYASGDTPGTLYIPKIDAAPLEFASNGTHEIKLEQPVLAIKKPAKCIAKFRPPDGWDGGFGFDWIRERDTGMVGDIDYRASLDPQSNLGAFNAEYMTFQVAKAKANDGDAQNAASWLNLFPADECPDLPHEATIKLLLDQRVEVPASIRVTSSKADYKDYVEIDEILPNTNGTHNIKVKSKKACTEDIVLELVNHTNDATGKDHEIVIGKLVIPKNDKPNRPEAKVVFVQAWTNFNGPVKKTSITYINRMIAVLKKYSAQALITIKAEVQKFDMTAGVKFWFMNTFSMNMTGIDEVNKNWVVPRPGRPLKSLLTDIYSRTHSSGARKMVHELLSKAFKEEYPQFADFYPIFMFDEPGVAIDEPAVVGGADTYVGLGGCADDIPGASVVVFGDDDDSTVSHELYHALGLAHPFDDTSVYPFADVGASDEYCNTDNIMDYSHLATPAIPMFQTWKWQWAILQNSIKTKTWT